MDATKRGNGMVRVEHLVAVAQVAGILCERKRRAPEALAYNGLIQSWPEITRLAREGGPPRAAQAGLFDTDEE